METMNISEFIKFLENQDIKLEEKEGRLRIDAPKDRVTPDLQARIKERKEEIIAYLQSPGRVSGPEGAEEVSDLDEVPELKKRDVPPGTVLPLGYTQLLFWFGYLDLKETVNLIAPIVLEGDLIPVLLEKSLNLLIDHHETIRASISDWQPVQTITECGPFNLPREDLSDVSEQERKKKISQKVASLLKNNFELDKPPLLAAQLFKLESKKHLLLLCIPHIVTDNAGLVLFRQHLNQTYQALVKDSPLPFSSSAIKISDYVQWERELYKPEAMEKELAFWKNKLGDYSYAHFPDKYLAKERKSIYDQFLYLKADLLEKLTRITTGQNATMIMSLVGIVAIGIHRFTGAQKLALHSIMENRLQKGTESLLAPLFAVLPIACNINREHSFVEILKGVRDSMLASYEYRRCPWLRYLPIIADKRWKKGSKVLKFFLKMVSHFLYHLYDHSKLYPLFFYDNCILDKSLSNFSLKNFFSGKKADTTISDPDINVNIMQSAFRRKESGPAESDSLRMIPLEDTSDFTPDETIEKRWEKETINFYICTGDNSETYINVVGSNLSDEGFKGLMDEIEKTLQFVVENPTTPIKELDN